MGAAMDKQSTPLRVLIVEDSENDAMLLLYQLRQGGYTVHAARVDRASEMTAALDREEWDVVVADYSMPQFSAPAQGFGSGTFGADSRFSLTRSGASDTYSSTNS